MVWDTISMYTWGWGGGGTVGAWGTETTIWYLRMIVRSGTSLVKSASTDVPHPLDDVVVAVIQFCLKHLQIPNLQTRGSKRYLYEEEV